MRMNLKEARMKAGLSQIEAAAIIAKTQSHYGKIERAEVGLTADDALVLCSRFDLTIQELMTVGG